MSSPCSWAKQYPDKIKIAEICPYYPDDCIEGPDPKLCPYFIEKLIDREVKDDSNNTDD